MRALAQIGNLPIAVYKNNTKRYNIAWSKHQFVTIPAPPERPALSFGGYCQRSPDAYASPLIWRLARKDGGIIKGCVVAIHDSLQVPNNINVLVILAYWLFSFWLPLQLALLVRFVYSGHNKIPILLKRHLMFL